MITEAARTYISMDRRQALARGQGLPERSNGAALFADISGFTPLTEALASELGPRRGAEELTLHLNRVYDALITQLHVYGGSVIGFSGDAITCWIDAGSDDNLQSAAARAIACGLAMQEAMQAFASVRTHAGSVFSLGIKVAIACGPVRRFVVGDPDYMLLDALTGRTLEQMVAAEHHAQRGEVVVHESVLRALEGAPSSATGVDIVEWRDEGRERFAVVRELLGVARQMPWQELAPDALDGDQERVWLLPPVYDRLQRGKGEFLAELRPAAALFIRFDGIRYDDDEHAPQKLDEFVRGVARILASYEGSLIQLTIGDKGSYLYAAFGAPVAHEDDALRAGAAALEMQEFAARLPYLQPLQIGLTDGRMRTGAYGSRRRRTYGVLGDAVNLAARLMAHARPGQILASAGVQAAAAETFHWERLPDVTVKGKSAPVAVYCLLRRRQRPAAQLHEPRYTLPMVGRAAEKELLSARLDQALAGKGQIVAITAEAGMGKSRLAAEALKEAQARSFEIFAGECQSYGVNTSYHVWHSICRGLFDVDVTAPHDELIAGLEAHLGQVNPSLRPRLPLLAPVLNVAIPDNELTASFDARLRKSSLESLLVDYLRARARQAPLVLVLDDCHWMDQLSHDLLEAIGRACAQMPLILLLAYRPPDIQRLEAPRVSRLPHFVEVPLTDFTPDEAQQLIALKLQQFFGDAARPPEEFVARITSRAAGNPFYIEEILNYLQDLGITPHDAHRLSTLELPTSIFSLILSRMDQLNTQQQITLRVASVIGRLFRAAMVWGVYPQLGAASSILEDLQTMSELELMVLDQPEPELTYLFKHVLTQEVAYESLPFATRAALHGQIGAYMEQTFAGELSRYVDLLAHHYDRSENDEKRREYLLQAAQAAQANYAHAAAVDYYRRVLPHLSGEEKGQPLFGLGQVLDWIGEYEEADTVYRDALAVAQQFGDSELEAQCQIAIGELARKQSDYAEAEIWFARAQATAEQSDNLAGLAKAFICFGSLAFFQGNYEDAGEYYGRSLALRRRLDDRADEANVLNNMGIVAASQGHFIRAEALFSASLEIRRELQQKWAIANSLGNLGQLATDLEQYEKAQTYLEEAMTLHRETGDRWRIGNALHSLANIHRAQGRWATAHNYYCESLQITRELVDRRQLAFLLEDVGGLSAQRGRAAAALRLAGAGAALREEIGAPLSPTDQSKLDEVLAPARASLDAGAQQAAWEAGRRLTLEQAVEEAIYEANVPTEL